jgi:hypothetical protein
MVDACPADFLDIAPIAAVARDRAQQIVNERAQSRAQRHNRG